MDTELEWLKSLEYYLTDSNEGAYSRRVAANFDLFRELAQRSFFVGPRIAYVYCSFDVSQVPNEFAYRDGVPVKD